MCPDEAQILQENREILPPSIQVISLRHAPTVWNKDHRLQGSKDLEVDPKIALEYLESIGGKNLTKPDLIIASGLKRSIGTARALSELNNWSGIQIIEDPQLNEKNWGVCEGHTETEAMPLLLEDPEFLKEFPDLTNPLDFKKIYASRTYRPPNGESIEDVKRRITPALINQVKAYQGKKIIMVLHGGVLDALEVAHSIEQFTLKVENDQLVVEK